jgi:hypothetical protein
MSGWNNPKYQITPNCCDAMRTSKAIMLRSSGDEDHGMSGRFNNPPHWQLMIAFNREFFGQIDYLILLEWFTEAVNSPVCCPFCGEKLPEIRLKQLHEMPKKVSTGTDGYYCSTCDKRNMECLCAPPWARWEVIPAEKTLVKNMSPLKCDDCNKELGLESIFTFSVWEQEEQEDQEENDVVPMRSQTIRVCASCYEPRKKDEEKKTKEWQEKWIESQKLRKE